MKKRFGIITLVCFLSISLIGQHESKRESYKAYKASFIQQKLSLTPEESEAFWPIYNAYEKELGEVKKKYRLKTDPFAEVSDAEADTMLKSIFKSEEEALKIKKKYQSQFMKVLPSNKVLKLHFLDRKFNREMLRKMKGRRGGSKNKEQ